MLAKKSLSALLALTLLGTAASVVAQDEQQRPPGYGMGPGTMHGWGPGPQNRGDWDDWHMGRGMMYGPGPMMGPGMMYGPESMGPGMMYGPGPMMGPGMMYGYGGYGPGNALNLNESQQKKMMEIQEELRKKHWDQMGKMNDEYAKLRELNNAEKRDPDAIGKQMQQIFDLRRQMMVESVKAQNRMEEQLTEEQRKQLRSYGPGWR